MCSAMPAATCTAPIWACAVTATSRSEGFAALAEHEDVLLVESLRTDPSLREVDTDECWVLTSGRFVGRSPGGYARQLRDRLQRSDEPPAEPIAASGGQADS